MLSPKNQSDILKRVDEELARIGELRTLIICGGGALIVMGIIDRQTRDVDVLEPEIDPILKAIAARIGKEFGLSEKWLNNGPESLRRDLNTGWEKRTTSIFKGKALELRGLGRADLLASKLFAFCDREDDFEDVLEMKPTKSELEDIFPWVLQRDGSAYWPKRVEDCFLRLRKKLKYE
jgi:Nucleotidyltransferase of unknown function (DUF6036)